MSDKKYSIGGEGVEIYVDILLFIGTVVDYSILRLTSRLAHAPVGVRRTVLSAFISSLFSLYIFLPELHWSLTVLIRLLSAFTAVVCCFGYVSDRKFLLRCGVFFAVSFAYAGAMLGVRLLYSPTNMVINNGVVYFDISPLLLITASLVLYLAFIIAEKLVGHNDGLARRTGVTLIIGDIRVKSTAMVDSGHGLKNLFGDSPVIIIDRNTAVKLLGAEPTAVMLSLMSPQGELASRFMVMPLKTVTGNTLRPAVRLDAISISAPVRSFQKPVAVITDGELGSDYSVIIPPETIYT